ncbi:Metacaspase-1 [Grifola frondosa]|uniref:Metacaspase-1 n=1 Tax=Grifola frondosa TaxID=5627 RepID=A0A1C7LSZ8_GRIFR|nr:Metacaspase-1 [Grifola frondosa]
MIRPPWKKALCIGLRYGNLRKIHEDLELTGAHNDPERMRKLLVDHYEYKEEDIVILRDDNGLEPTKDLITKKMQDLVRGAQPGDHFVFHFSGHGSQVDAIADPNEIDGRDEVIWPYDVKLDIDDNGQLRVQNFIRDDDIKRYLVDRLPPRVRLALVFDCCHSGTAADLPYNFHFNVDEGNFIQEESPRRIILARGSSPYGGCTPIDHGFITESGMPEVRAVTVKPTFTRQYSAPSGFDTPADVTSWAACMDDQLGFDCPITGGLFIQLFTCILDCNPAQTHRNFLETLTMELAHQCKSYNLNTKDGEICVIPRPQLGSLRHSREILDTLFVL